MEENSNSNLFKTKKDNIFSSSEKNNNEMNEIKRRRNSKFKPNQSLIDTNSKLEKTAIENIIIDKSSDNTECSPKNNNAKRFLSPRKKLKNQKNESKLKINNFIYLEKRKSKRKSNNSLSSILAKNLTTLEPLNSFVEASDNYSKENNTNLQTNKEDEPNIQGIESLLNSKKQSKVSKNTVNTSKKLRSTLEMDRINLNLNKRNSLINNLITYNEKNSGVNSSVDQSDSLISYKNLILKKQSNISHDHLNLHPSKNESINEIWRRSITIKNNLLNHAKGLDATVPNNNGSILRKSKTKFENLNLKDSFEKSIYRKYTNSPISPKKKKRSLSRNLSFRIVEKLKYEKYISALTNYKKRRLLLIDKHINDDKKEQLKILKEIPKSSFYKNSELILKKIKISYFILSIFSILSIFFSYTDVKLYNNNSWELLLHNNNKSTTNYGIDFSIRNITEYKIIQNRIITNKENTIRIFLAIFNITCGLLIILINCFIKQFKQESNVLKTENTPTFSSSKHNNYLNVNYSINKRDIAKLKNKHKDELFNKKSYRKNSLKNEEFSIKQMNNIGILKKISSLLEYFTLKNFISLIIKCILNMLFIPPSVNKVFIGFERKVIYVYTLNSIFMIINFFKLINIYQAVYYISPFNNMLTKIICHSNMATHNVQFMNKMNMAKSPFLILLISWIIITLSISYILHGVEYLSIDTIKGNYSEKGENNFKNTYNCIYLYLFIILRVAFGDQVTRTILGKIILVFGGLIGSMIEGFLIYNLLQIVELNKDEHKAYSKLHKLFNPENKENKAANFIKTVLLIKKHVKENKENINLYFQKVSNKKTSFIQKLNNFNEIKNNKNNEKNNNFENMLEKTKIINNDDIDSQDNNEINAIRRKKFITNLEHIFVLKIKFFCDYKSFIDNYKICRSSTMSFIDAVKNLENKLIDNIDYLSSILDKTINIDDEFIELINANKNASIDLQKLYYYDQEIKTVLYNILNEANKKFIIKRKKRIEKVEKKSIKDDSGVKSGKGFNFFFFTASGDKRRNNTNLPNMNKKLKRMCQSGGNDSDDDSSDSDGGFDGGFLFKNKNLENDAAKKKSVTTFLIGNKKDNNESLKFHGLK